MGLGPGGLVDYFVNFADARSSVITSPVAGSTK
jgi:hypothetical protein